MAQFCHFVLVCIVRYTPNELLQISADIRAYSTNHVTDIYAY